MWREMVACLEALGFIHDRDESSHKVYVHEATGRIVVIDCHWTPASGPMVAHVVKYQVKVSRETFYGATKATAKKIGK